MQNGAKKKIIIPEKETKMKLPMKTSLVIRPAKMQAMPSHRGLPSILSENIS